MLSSDTRLGIHGELADTKFQRSASAPRSWSTRPRVRDVAAALRHLLAVLVQEQREADDVAVRRAVEHERVDREQGVEPAAGLVDRLADEVGGEAALERVLVLERVVQRRGGHRARSRTTRRAPARPATPGRRRTPGSRARRRRRTAGAGPGRSRGWPASSESSATDPTQVSCPQSRHRHTGIGVPQNRSRDSAQSTLFSSQSPKRPCLMCSGCQLMVSFSRSIAAFDRRRAREPRGLGPVDERRAAAPAVRVRVQVRLDPHQAARGFAAPR